MNYTLDNSHPAYIQINTQGLVEIKSFMPALSELLSHPEYPSKHTIWNFSQSQIGLSIGDMKEIAGVLRLYKPTEKNFANKSALVVPDNMARAMAGFYISISRLLPFDYRIFKGLEDARAFVTRDLPPQN